jgi:hypothetical protein
MAYCGGPTLAKVECENIDYDSLHLLYTPPTYS